MVQPLFNLKNVHFNYDGEALIEALDLEISPGVFYGILGPNGAGKSTLLNLLTGASQPASGKIQLEGKELNRYSKRELAQIFAVVPQDYGVNFPFNVLEMVMMGRKPHLKRFQSPGEEDLKKVHEAMIISETLGFADRLVTQLSGGEKQRVIFARALAQDPKVLFLDEATSNLDIKHKLSVLKTVRRLNREKGLSVIAVLHDLNIAGLYCDQVILMEKGKVLFCGPASEVLTSENIRRVFGVETEVSQDADSGKLHISLLDDLAG